MKCQLIAARIILFGVTLCFQTPTYADDIAFFYALDADFQSFKTQAEFVGKPTLVCGHSIQKFELGKHRIYAVKMGSGPVASAVSATALLTRFHCDLAISIGPVGALGDALQVGDWRQVGKIVFYQKGSWGKEGPQKVKSSVSDDQKSVYSQPTLSLAAFKNATESNRLTVASGEMFVTSTSYREQLHSDTGAQAVDMNLFGLTTACAAADVPIWSWRVVSDRADDDASTDFRAFVTNYDGIGGLAAVEAIRQLPPNPNNLDSYPALKNLLKDH